MAARHVPDLGTPPHRSSAERRRAQRAVATSAEQAIRHLRDEVARCKRQHDELLEAVSDPEVRRRLCIAAPALAGLLAGTPVQSPQVLQRNVALHAVSCPQETAPLAVWRKAQHGGRLSSGTNKWRWNPDAEPFVPAKTLARSTPAANADGDARSTPAANADGDLERSVPAAMDSCENAGLVFDGASANGTDTEGAAVAAASVEAAVADPGVSVKLVGLASSSLELARCAQLPQVEYGHRPCSGQCGKWRRGALESMEEVALLSERRGRQTAVAATATDSNTVASLHNLQTDAWLLGADRKQEAGHADNSVDADDVANCAWLLMAALTILLLAVIMECGHRLCGVLMLCEKRIGDVGRAKSGGAELAYGCWVTFGQHGTVPAFLGMVYQLWQGAWGRAGLWMAIMVLSIFASREDDKIRAEAEAASARGTVGQEAPLQRTRW